MKVKNNNHISILCSICLLGVMILTSMILIIFAASSFKRLRTGTSSAYVGNTATSYVANKIRSHDHGGISVGCIDDIEYITLSDNNNQYKTVIYAYEGYLYENLMKADKDLVIGKGEKILKLDSIKFELSNYVMYIYADNQNKTYKSSVKINADSSVAKEVSDENK